MARATSSLPVPVSPKMSTVESVCATFATCARTLCSADDEPTISSNIEARSRSSRSAIVSLRIRSSMRLRSSISVQALAFGSQYGDELRCEVEHLPQLDLSPFAVLDIEVDPDPIQDRAVIRTEWLR